MKEHLKEKNLFGFWVYLMSDCVLFAGLFAVYAVLHSATVGNGAPGLLFSVPFVFAETIILLTSSFSVGLAMLFASEGRKTHSLIALFVTLILGFSFLGMEISEFARLVHDGFGPSASAFLSAFFTLVGTHGLHVFVGSLWMVALIGHTLHEGLSEGNTRKLMQLSLFWHFLDIVWIFIFTVIYLMGVI